MSGVGPVVWECSAQSIFRSLFPLVLKSHVKSQRAQLPVGSAVYLSGPPMEDSQVAFPCVENGDVADAFLGSSPCFDEWDGQSTQHGVDVPET